VRQSLSATKRVKNAAFGQTRLRRLVGDDPYVIQLFTANRADNNANFTQKF
jgi:hypothetical protein